MTDSGASSLHVTFQPGEVGKAGNGKNASKLMNDHCAFIIIIFGFLRLCRYQALPGLC